LVIAIQKILCVESIRCHWWAIGRAANPTRGSVVTWLTVPHPVGDALYATREGVESQGAAAIEMRYKVAWGDPILQNARLYSDFGFLANTVLADQVLQVSYIYPKNMDTTYQTPVAGGTTHLPQTLKGRASGFCLDY
jgi:hypothetical protein